MTVSTGENVWLLSVRYHFRQRWMLFGVPIRDTEPIRDLWTEEGPIAVWNSERQVAVWRLQPIWQVEGVRPGRRGPGGGLSQ